VEDRDGDGIGRVRPERNGQRGEQAPLPEHAQEPPPSERGRVDVHERRLWERKSRE
jgi:hypothetical protein